MASRDVPWKRTQKRLSGYQFFLRTVLDELKVQHPDSSIVLSEVSKLCAETWQNLHDEIKKRFQDEADSINHANFKLTGDKNLKPGINGSTPKRPLSAFILFCKDNRQSIKKLYPDLSMGEISSVLSIMWGKAEEEAKLKYKEASKQQRELYREEMKASASKKSTARSSTDKKNKM